MTKHFSATGGDRKAGTGEASDGQPKKQPNLRVAPQPSGQFWGPRAPPPGPPPAPPPLCVSWSLIPPNDLLENFDFKSLILN